MEKTLEDIINILMQIELNFSKVYKNIAEVNEIYPDRLKTIARILSRDELIHYEQYKKLLEEKSFGNLYVYGGIYERIADVMKGYKDTISWDGLSGEKNIIRKSIEYEVKNREALIEIHEYLSEINDERNSEIMEFIGDLIVKEEKHANDLRKYL